MKKKIYITILLLLSISAAIFVWSHVPKTISLEYPAVEYSTYDTGYTKDLKIKIKGKLFKGIFSKPVYKGVIDIAGYGFTKKYELIPITFNPKIMNGMGSLTYTTVIDGKPVLETLGAIWITDNFKSINIEVNNSKNKGTIISAPAKTLKDALTISQTFYRESTEKSEQYKIPDQINLPYDIRQSLSFVNKKDSIKHLYGNPDLVRSSDEYSYEIRNMDDGSKLFVFYDGNGIVRNIWRLKKLFSREEFHQIKIGKSTGDDVEYIDPYCVIADVSEKDAMSEHKLQNNQIVKIKYLKDNDKWIVNDIEYIEKDPSEFELMLLPEDLKSLRV